MEPLGFHPDVIAQVTEKAWSQKLEQAFRFWHWRFYHTYNSQRSPSGFPDYVAVRRGRLLFVELKTQKGRLSPAQRDWLSDLLLVARPVETYTWRPVDWPTVVEVLR